MLVFTEGEKTEGHYLNVWNRAHRDAVIITISDYHGTPMSLVNTAIEEKELEQRESRRGRGAPHDEVWCMFDVDEHPRVEEAVALAAEHNINVAVSNPCLELWFLLHFEEQTAWIHRDHAQSRSEALLGCRKTLTSPATAALLARYPDARKRAAALDTKHLGDGSPPGSNPSSSVWRLIDSVIGA